MLAAALCALLCSSAAGFTLPCGTRPAAHRRSPAPRAQSLAEQMFGDVFKGVKGLADQAGKAMGGGEEEPPPPVPTGDGVASDLDERARTGQIDFNDFLTLSSALDSMGDGRAIGAIAGAGKLSAAELAETRTKFIKHERIVEVMLPEERTDPSLLVDDIKAGASTPGPRLQRLARAADLPETEIALFVMQFEAMRESTQRIAAGEDPDDVNESIGAAGATNRAARRELKKKAKRAKKKKM